jgi:hypothetical protein
MSHFAKLDDANIVIDVIVLNNEVIDNFSFPESEPVGIQFLTEWSNGHTNWKQTSYNASFRKNYAVIDFNYNLTLDAFIAPQPYPSWTLNTETCTWEASVPYPSDGALYSWDELNQQWIKE